MNILLTAGLVLLLASIVFSVVPVDPTPTTLLVCGVTLFACGVGHSQTGFGSGGVWR